MEMRRYGIWLVKNTQNSSLFDPNQIAREQSRQSLDDGPIQKCCDADYLAHYLGLINHSEVPHDGGEYWSRAAWFSCYYSRVCRNPRRFLMFGDTLSLAVRAAVAHSAIGGGVM